jgi:uncharacterized LabA/DUF88 family protein
MNDDKKIAIFFDCENVSSKYVEDIFKELAKQGEVTIRQAYKDWSAKQSRSWNTMLGRFAIKPIQTKINTSSKNVSDFQIVIDVMNTMYYHKVDTIVLVSSDSDFTSLVMEIKAKGFEVIGFGEEKTPEALINAYSTFYQLSIKKSESELEDIVSILKDAINSTKNDDDYTLISQIGLYLKNKSATLNAKNYNANTWGEILRQYPNIFEIFYLDERKSQIAVRIR